VSQQLRDDLARARDETLGFFRATGAAELGRSYAPGKWTMRQLLIHIADAETVLFDRLRRLQAEEKPLLWAFDENRWAEHLLYDRRSLEVAGALFAATRGAVIELAAIIPAERHVRAGIHSEAGRKTFAEVLAHVLWPHQHHHEQIRACAAGAAWTAAARP